MPIINQDDPLVRQNLVLLGSTFDVPVLNDTVIASGMFQQHTITTRYIHDEVGKNTVLEINGVRCRVMTVDRTIHNSNVMVVLTPITNTLPFAPGSIISIYKNYHPIDNLQLTDSSIQYDVRNNIEMYLYIDYVQGPETDVRMYFTLRDIKQTNLSIPFEYALMTVTDPTGGNVPYNLKLTTTGRYSLPVTFPDPTEFLTANFAWSGATPVTGGTIKVFANTDKNYYV